MSLSTREVLLVVRANNQASAVLATLGAHFGTLNRQAVASSMALGGAMIAVGAVTAAVGVKILSFYKNSIDAAMTYDQQAAKTLTQVDKLGLSLNDIKTIGRNVAKEIPVPFESLQASLYDIFSSMQVNGSQAENMLRNFGKAAVAGQVDIQTAGRATIAILNAWKLPAEQVTHVNDIMFQLVRKGVGTYEEFSSTIGRAIPSTVKAGQSVETLAGMLAFLTRNGLSAEMAAAAAGRGMDALSNPGSVKNLEKMGVSVKNAQGEFRPLVDIVKQLSEKMSTLTGPQRAAALHDLFKGSGSNIQAMRFWTLATTNFGDLKDRIGDLNNSAGALNGAYDIMFVQPQTKIELLKNKLAVLKTQVGDALVPVFLALVGIAGKLLDAWGNLSPGLQKFIIYAVGIGAVLMVLVGIITVVAGIFLVLSAAATALGIGLGTIALWGSVFIVAIVAIIAAGYLLWKHWDWVKAEAIKIWRAIANFFVTTWESVKAKTLEIWNAIIGFFVRTWNDLFRIVSDSLSGIKDVIVGVWDAIAGFFSTMWNTIAGIFMTGVHAVWGVISSVFNAIKDWLAKWWPLLLVVFFFGIALIMAIWNRWGDDLIRALKALWNDITGFFSSAWTNIANITSVGWNAITGIVTGAWNAFAGWIDARWENFKTNVSSLWSIVTQLTSAGWKAITDAISGPWNAFVGWIDTRWENFKTNIISLWNIVSQLTTAGWKAITDVVMGAWNTVTTWLGNRVSDLAKIGNQLWDGLKQGVIDAAKDAAKWIGDVMNGLLDAAKSFLGIQSPSTEFAKIGVNLIKGLMKGIASSATELPHFMAKVLGGIPGLAAGMFKKGAHIGGEALSWLGGKGAGFANKLGIGAGSDAMQGFIGATGLSGQLQSWIAQAIGITGVGADWTGPLSTLIMRESGGNPNAINLTDSNAKAGYPSRGLMQTIPQTFAAYRDASLPNNIVDPVANLVAGIKYILANYGSIFNVQQAVGGTPKGYFAGGYIDEHVYGIGSRTGRPYEFGEGNVIERVGSRNTRTDNATTVPITIHTQEIDPRKHAAELGWEIARRVG